MDRGPGDDVGDGVRRMDPTLIAAIVLGALILLIVAMMFLGSRSSEDDRLTGDEVASTSEDPTVRCSNKSTVDLVKNELFREAASDRGGDAGAAFDQIASLSSARVEAVVLRDESAEGLTCNGTLTIDLPPGVAVSAGRRTLSADILYTVQSNGNPAGVSLTNADELIAQLATVAKIQSPTGEAPPNGVTNVVEAPPAPSDPLGPLPGGNSAGQYPSFNCADAKTAGEIAVCNDPGLSALDRRMAAQYANALSQGDPEQRALLQRTRDSFLGYRDQCTENACIADTYRGRMREIRDIMTGDWTPQR